MGSIEESLSKLPPVVPSGLLLLGLFTVTKLLLKTARVFAQTFLWPGTSLKKYGAGDKSTWAVVTGATDGIGKEFAFQLARAGFNIVLISRSEEKLRAVAGEIESKHSVATQVFAIDFSTPTEEQYSTLTEKFSDLKVGVLVNNVGRSHELPTSFNDTPLAEQEAIININVHGTLRITRIFLRGMVERHRGLILTISSFAGVIPSPLLAVYSGSKAFLQTWSDALQAELLETGVQVECVATYFVVSNMSRIRRSSALIPTPKAYVRAVLSKIGLACGALGTGRPSASTPYWSHSLIDYLIHLIGWKEAFIGYTHGLHKDIRKRALRKKERDVAASKIE